jgi:hypothetical protein
MGIWGPGNNFGGAMKRSVAIAMIVAFGNLGGLIASYTYVLSHLEYPALV